MPRKVYVVVETEGQDWFDAGFNLEAAFNSKEAAEIRAIALKVEAGVWKEFSVEELEVEDDA